MTLLRVATRGSRLAIWQTEHVIAALRKVDPDLAVEVVRIKTSGDLITDIPLSSIGSSSFFTKEIESALLRGVADLAVHSLKDLASKDVPPLELAATLPREDARDALVSTSGVTLAALPTGARVGTSSVRRQAMLRAQRPDLEILDLRGNVPTRVDRLDEGLYDAIILAAAGLKRLGLGDRISEFLDPEVFVPPAGQGAIALQVRADDDETMALAEALNHEETRIAIDTERAFLSELDVGCQSPVGVYARCVGDELEVSAVVVSPDGSRRIEVTESGPRRMGGETGRRLADAMRAAGGAEILAVVSRSGGHGS